MSFQNFDIPYEVSDDESVLSTSSNGSSSKKFKLGSNIYSSVPLEIFSVRQNDFFCTEKTNIDDADDKYMLNNNFICGYDESIGDLESETVSDSSFDELGVNRSGPVRYELPEICRYQQCNTVEHKSQIDSISRQCLNEKKRRMEAGFGLLTEECLNPVEKSARTIDINIKNDEFPIEKLSELPVEILAEFINGDKTIREIVSKSKRKSNKKNSRKVNNKLYTKQQTPIIKNSDSDNPAKKLKESCETVENVVECDAIKSLEIVEAESIDSIVRVIVEEIKSELSKDDVVNEQLKDTQLSDVSKEYLQSFDENFDYHQEQLFVETKNYSEKKLNKKFSRYTKRHQYIFNKQQNSYDSWDQSFVPYEKQKTSSYYHRPKLSSTTYVNRNLVHNVSPAKDNRKIYKPPQRYNNFGSFDNNNISSNNTLADNSNCKPSSTTSSTDSGYNEHKDEQMDSNNECCPSNDFGVCLHQQNLQPSPLCDMAADNNVEEAAVENNNSSLTTAENKNVSIENILDFSCFKFKFLQEESASVVLGDDEKERTNNSNTVNCSSECNDFELKETLPIIPSHSDNPEIDADKSDACHKNIFKINYYSINTNIENYGQVSEFLTFLWLKFCEKHTVYNLLSS